MELTATSQYTRNIQLLQSSTIAPTRTDTGDASETDKTKTDTFSSAAKAAKRDAVLVDKLQSALDDLKDAEESRRNQGDQVSAYRRTANALRHLHRHRYSDGAEEADKSGNAGGPQAGFGGAGTTVTDFRLDASSSSSLSITSDNLSASFTTNRSVSVGPDGISFSFSQTASAQFTTDSGVTVSVELSRAREAYIGTGSGYQPGSGYDAAA